jgi:hypothetical protein
LKWKHDQVLLINLVSNQYSVITTLHPAIQKKVLVYNWIITVILNLLTVITILTQTVKFEQLLTFRNVLTSPKRSESPIIHCDIISDSIPLRCSIVAVSPSPRLGGDLAGAIEAGFVLGNFRGICFSKKYFTRLLDNDDANTVQQCQTSISAVKIQNPEREVRAMVLNAEGPLFGGSAVGPARAGTHGARERGRNRRCCSSRHHRLHWNSRSICHCGSSGARRTIGTRNAASATGTGASPQRDLFGVDCLIHHVIGPLVPLE